MSKSPREIYLDKVLVGSPEEKQKQQDKALEYAHRVRQFEIDLFWKRSAYFWVFIALAFVGYFKLALGPNSSLSSVQLQFALVALSGIGFILSYLWWLANKGSRFWPESLGEEH